MKRYLVLFVAALTLGLALVALARRPGGPAKPTVTDEAPVVSLALTITDHGLSPDGLVAPKGAHVALTVTNQSAKAHVLTLAGYEDRLAIERLAPGARWTGELLADRPGDDFAWIVDGQPMGRFIVQGPHLVEGHR